MNQPRGLLKLLKLDSLKSTLIDYVETRIELVRAEVKDTILVAMRAAMIYGSIAVLGLFFVLFLSLTIALVLNEVLDSTFWGFAIVTGLYLLMVVTLYLLRNSEKVKMMFGDGSLAFLKAKPNKQDKQQNTAQTEEGETETATVEEEGQIKYERVTFDRSPEAKANNVPKGKPANIHIEKKEEE